MGYVPYQENQEGESNKRYMMLPQNVGGMSEITLVSQTSPSVVFEKIEHRFRGEKWNSEKQEWVEVKELRMMNEKGINSVMADVEAASNFIWSNFQTDDEVMRIVNRLGKTITRKISMNWKEFGVTKSNMTSVVMFVCYQVLGLVRRGYQHQEQEFIKKNVIEHHQTAQQIMPNQRQMNSEGKKHFWEVWKK